MAMKFYIIKTRTEDFYFGILAPKYDRIISEEEFPNDLWVNKRMIPNSNIDFYLTNLTFDEFLKYSNEYQLSEYDDERMGEIIEAYEGK